MLTLTINEGQAPKQIIDNTLKCLRLMNSLTGGRFLSSDQKN